MSYEDMYDTPLDSHTPLYTYNSSLYTDNYPLYTDNNPVYTHNTEDTADCYMYIKNSCMQ